MANVLSGWTAGRYVNLVVRGAGDDGVVIKRVPAKWSFFATGLDDEDRYVLGRDRRVSGVALAGEYTRVDCVNRWGRDDVLQALERASLASDDRDIQLLEADVAPLCRLLSDVGSLDVDPRPRLGYFDLEVDSRRSFDDMRKGAAHILSWAVVDGAGAVVGAAVLRDTSKASERALLRGFFDAVKDLDCLLAWNGESFDFEVLRNRAGVLGVEPPIDWMRWTWLDHMLVFKKYNMHSDDSGVAKVSYALNHVAEYLLGEGKVDFDASRTWEAWEAGGKSRQQLLDYNVHDVVLMQRVEEKTGYLSLHLAVCHICRVFPDTSSLNATRQGDGFLLRLGAERGYRWPTKVHVEETKRFAGAYVMEPRRLGAVDSVHVADFAGLYPSIMRTFNMGLDTKLDGPSEGACKLPGRDTYFRQDRDGMFRVALDRLVGKRAEYQRAMKECAPGTAEHEQFNRLSKAFKIVANSFYGICGSPYSRFFDVEIAEGVTQTGKWLLQQVIAAAESDGFDPFYGDTDSVFVAGDGDRFRRFVIAMNSSWASRLREHGVTGEHHIDLDFEKTFRRLIMVSAKRYAGAFAMYKGQDASATKPEVKGLEFKRGDTLSLAREFQTEVVLALLEPELPAVDRMWAMVARWRERVLRGELQPADVTLSQSLSRPVSEYSADYTRPDCARCGERFLDGRDASGPDKCGCGELRKRREYPAHVRVAVEMARRGKPIQEGGRVSYMIVEGDGANMVPVAADEPGAFERIDREYYWQRRVFPPSRRLLEIVYPDVEWGETRQDKAARVAERSRGQRTLFDIQDPPRKRRRRQIQIAFDAVAPGRDGATDGDRVRLQAVRAAIEAHPGDVPVVLVYRWDDCGKGVEVRLPVGLSIRNDAAALRAIERVIGDGKVIGARAV